MPGWTRAQLSVKYPAAFSGTELCPTERLLDGHPHRFNDLWVDVESELKKRVLTS